MRHLRLALLLGAAGAVGSALVLPYALALMPDVFARAERVVSLPVMVAAQVAQAFVVFTLVSWAGLRVGETMGLDAPILRAWVQRLPVRVDRRTLLVACATGIVAALAIVLADKGLQPWMPAAKIAIPAGIDRWKGFLASFYGGIGEEVQLRLFFMTMLLWLAWKALARGRPAPPPLAAWIAIVIAAIVFGAGHLPAASQVWPLDGVVVFRAIFLNSLVGVPCGWLFWRHGLEHAIAAHFSADIVLHVVFAG